MYHSFIVNSFINELPINLLNQPFISLCIYSFILPSIHSFNHCSPIQLFIDSLIHTIDPFVHSPRSRLSIQFCCSVCVWQGTSSKRQQYRGRYFWNQSFFLIFLICFLFFQWCFLQESFRDWILCLRPASLLSYMGFASGTNHDHQIWRDSLRSWWIFQGLTVPCIRQSYSGFHNGLVGYILSQAAFTHCPALQILIQLILQHHVILVSVRSSQICQLPNTG